MFTGIIQSCACVKKINSRTGLKTFHIEMDDDLRYKLKQGASVAVNGVCLTVAGMKGTRVLFDVMQETLHKTNLSSLKKNSVVNIERSVKQGDELGGHIVSGHVDMTAKIVKISTPENNCIIRFKCAGKWMKYIYPKGFIAINGASLTVVRTYQKGGFTVHLIPETLKATTFDRLSVGEKVNIEIDRQTQVIVTTIENYLSQINR